jgi:hypothetical protein
MVQPKYSPEEALQRVKLMMGYDTKKTLKENIETIGVVLNEQTTAGEASSIASKLWSYMAGDVETEDLEGAQQIFNDQVFGKTFKDGCLLEKVLEYYKGHQGSFTWSLTTTYHEGGFLDDLDHSDEMGEPEFADVKKDLRDSIEKELNGFCKTQKKEEETLDCTKTPNDPKCKKKTDDSKTGGYVQCSGTYKYGCKSEVIRKVQGCLGGLATDGKFGPKTKGGLLKLGKGFENGFTDADVDVICKSQTAEVKPEVGGEITSVSTADANF